MFRNHLGFYIVLLLTIFFCAALVLVPAACSKQTETTIKTDGSGCLKAIPSSTYVSVLVDATGPDAASKLEQDALSIGEDLVVCAAKDLFAALTAKAAASSGSGSGSGSASAGPITAMSDHTQAIAAQNLKAFLDKRGVK